MTTMKNEILALLRAWYPEMYTATRLATVLQYGLASVSSQLKKLCDDQLLVRYKGYGPRGGFGYMYNCLFL